MFGKLGRRLNRSLVANGVGLGESDHIFNWAN